MSIVEKFDVGFQSMSRRRRVWTAFKAATHSKHVQRFRDSLNETKSTLTLAMVHERYEKFNTIFTYVVMLTIKSVVQARTHGFFTGIDVFESTNQHTMVERARQKTIGFPRPRDLSTWNQVHSRPSKYVGQRSSHRLPSVSAKMARNTLRNFEKAVPEQSMARFEIQKLMLHAIAQTAIATFETTSLDILAQDGYMIDECGQLRSKTFVYAENIRYRVRNHATSFRTAFGCVWVRTTTIYPANDPGNTTGKSQTINSFVFYPKTWLQFVGVRHGLEAVVASAGRSWLFNCRLTVTRAVPEDSLIFDLCSKGETRAVEILLEKGLGSVVDTSPKGWKPLHVSVRFLSIHIGRSICQTLTNEDLVCCSPRSC